MVLLSFTSINIILVPPLAIAEEDNHNDDDDNGDDCLDNISFRAPDRVEVKADESHKTQILIDFTTQSNDETEIFECEDTDKHDDKNGKKIILEEGGIIRLDFGECKNNCEEPFAASLSLFKGDEVNEDDLSSFFDADRLDFNQLADGDLFEVEFDIPENIDEDFDILHITAASDSDEAVYITNNIKIEK